MLITSCQGNGRQEVVGPSDGQEVIGMDSMDIEQAISDGLDYLERQGDSIDPLLFPILDYMNLAYEVERSWPYQDAIELRKRDSNYYQYPMIRCYLGYKPYNGINEKDIEAIPERTRGLVHGYLCESFPIGEDYLFDYTSTIAKDSLGYGLTHAILMLQWMEDKNCVTNREKVIRLKEEYSRHLQSIIHKNQALTDLRTEAMAIAFYTQQDYLVEQHHIQEVLDFQDSSGGWLGTRVTHHIGNHHFTTLAVWVLSAYQHRNKEHQPWRNQLLNQE